jgi:hypothetical protein
MLHHKEGVSALCAVRAYTDDEALGLAAKEVRHQRARHGLEPTYIVAVLRPDGSEIGSFSIADLSPWLRRDLVGRTRNVPAHARNVVISLWPTAG